MTFSKKNVDLEFEIRTDVVSFLYGLFRFFFGIFGLVDVSFICLFFKGLKTFSI